MTSVADILKKNRKWMTRDDFLKSIIEEAKISERQAYRMIKKAIEEKEIRKIVLPDRGTVYGLPEWPISDFGLMKTDKKSEDLQLVKDVLEELRIEYRSLREPTIKEVAIKVGKAPEAVMSLLYELAPETGWNEQGWEKAKEEAEESINLAGWMKWLQKGDEPSKYSSEQIEELNKIAREETRRAVPAVLRRAESILKNFPELVPEAKPRKEHHGRVSGFVPTGLDPWPEETNRVWRHIFQEEAPKSGREGIFSAYV